VLRAWRGGWAAHEDRAQYVEVRGQGLHGAKKARITYNRYAFKWRFPDFDVHIA